MGFAAALSGIGSLVGAFGQFQAQNYAAQQSQRAAEVGRVQADQIDTSYRTELNDTLANIRAIRSSAGVAPDSPTGMAYAAKQEATSNRDRIIEVGNKRMQANQDAADARFRRSAANISLLGGIATGLGNSLAQSSFFGQ